MTPAEVYLSHPSFACYPKDRFIANLANLKEALRIERERVAQEEKEFLREHLSIPEARSLLEASRLVPPFENLVIQHPQTEIQTWEEGNR